MDNKYPEFGRRVTLAMEAHDISVTDVKNRLEVSYEMARRYKLGQAIPRQDKIGPLAELLRLSPAELQFGEPGFSVDSGALVVASQKDSSTTEQVNASDVIRLIDLYAQSSPDGRQFILNSAVTAAADKLSADGLVKSSGDKP